MSQSLEELVPRLLSLSDDIFYDALADLSRDSAYDLSALETLFRLLAESAIPELRKRQRLRTIVQRLALADETILHLARAAPVNSATLRNELASLLPPTDRRSIHQKPGAYPIVLKRGAEEGTGAVVSTATHVSRPPDTTDGAAKNTVLLLGQREAQEQNRKLLEGFGYGCVPVDTEDKLTAELTQNVDICGVVVDRTFLDGLGSADRLVVFENVAQYSSLIWVRIDGTGVKDFEEVRNIFRMVWATRGPVAAREVSIQTSNRIFEGELGDLRRAADLLREIYGVTFSPREISNEERRVLVAALREHHEQLRFDGTVHVEVVETRMVQNGKSGARVAIVSVNRNGRSLIAKFDSKQNLLRELTNYRRYVQSIEDSLQPLACFHGSAGVLLSTLIAEERTDDEPAQTLMQRISSFRQRDMMQITPQDSANLREALLNTAHTIAKFAKSHVASTEPLRVHLDHVTTLEARGVTWGVHDGAAVVRDSAVKRFLAFPTRAVTHGDLNLRNILVYAERGVQLIDFAWCGPGHPADDLVRFEVGLFATFLMPTHEQTHYESFQRKLTYENASADELISEFAKDDPGVNALCIHGCVAARDAAVAAVKHHGGTHDDYVAAKLIVAWQHLPFEERQFTLARAIINTLSLRTPLL
ncbi:MAG TPA: phosphotransferase [Thermoanaerobaculia bacterium]|jgi:thiamine kinase-like enzyme